MAWVEDTYARLEDWVEWVLLPLPNGKAKTILVHALVLPFRVIGAFIFVVTSLFIVSILINSVFKLLSGGIPAVVRSWVDLFDVFR